MYCAIEACSEYISSSRSAGVCGPWVSGAAAAPHLAPPHWYNPMSVSIATAVSPPPLHQGRRDQGARCGVSPRRSTSRRQTLGVGQPCWAAREKAFLWHRPASGCRSSCGVIAHTKIWHPSWGHRQCCSHDVAGLVWSVNLKVRERYGTDDSAVSFGRLKAQRVSRCQRRTTYRDL